MLEAAAEPITWPDLSRAVGREPKDGTARRLRDDLLTTGELLTVEKGLLKAAKVPEGLAPLQTALPSGEQPGCQGVAVPIGGSEDGTLSDADRQICRYPEHREHDYTGDGGRTICGVCHPRRDAGE
jgi:hypothetical protein